MVDSHTWASLYNNAQLGDGTSPDQLRFSEKAIRHFKDGDQPLLYPSVDWLDYVMKDSAPNNNTMFLYQEVIKRPVILYQ